MKESTLTDPLYRIVEFQPSGLSREEITRVAINLARRSYNDFDYPPEGAMQKSDLHLRLTPWLWGDEKPYTEEDWWYIYPVEELDNKLRDMLAKIIKYGIPIIEDMNTTNELAITMRKNNG